MLSALVLAAVPAAATVLKAPPLSRPISGPRALSAVNLPAAKFEYRLWSSAEIAAMERAPVPALAPALSAAPGLSPAYQPIDDDPNFIPARPRTPDQQPAPAPEIAPAPAAASAPAAAEPRRSPLSRLLPRRLREAADRVAAMLRGGRVDAAKTESGAAFDGSSSKGDGHFSFPVPGSQPADPGTPLGRSILALEKLAGEFAEKRKEWERLHPAMPAPVSYLLHDEDGGVLVFQRWKQPDVTIEQFWTLDGEKRVLAEQRTLYGGKLRIMTPEKDETIDWKGEHDSYQPDSPGLSGLAEHYSSFSSWIPTKAAPLVAETSVTDNYRPNYRHPWSGGHTNTTTTYFNGKPVLVESRFWPAESHRRGPPSTEVRDGAGNVIEKTERRR